MGIDLNKRIKLEELLVLLGEGDWAIMLPNDYPDLVLTAAWRQELKETACHWFVRWVLGGVSYDICHDDDPPWDYSGEAHRNTHESEMLLLRYATLNHWMEEEYTGNKRPTFDSHCGWAWDTYKHDFEEAISEKLFHLVQAHLSQFIENVDDIDPSDAIDNIDLYLEHALMEIVGRIRTMDAWREYEVAVMKLLVEERREMAERAAHYARMRQRSRDFWQSHFADVGREKIELPQFEARGIERRLTEALADADPETVDAIAVVGLPICCSNSVESVIKHLAQQATTDCQHISRLYDSF